MPTNGELAKEGLLFLASIAEKLDKHDAEGYTRIISNPPADIDAKLRAVQLMLNTAKSELDRRTTVADPLAYGRAVHEMYAKMHEIGIRQEVESGLIHLPQPGDVLKAIVKRDKDA